MSPGLVRGHAQPAPKIATGGLRRGGSGRQDQGGERDTDHPYSLGWQLLGGPKRFHKSAQENPKFAGC